MDTHLKAEESASHSGRIRGKQPRAHDQRKIPVRGLWAEWAPRGNAYIEHCKKGNLSSDSLDLTMLGLVPHVVADEGVVSDGRAVVEDVAVGPTPPRTDQKAQRGPGDQAVEVDDVAVGPNPSRSGSASNQGGATPPPTDVHAFERMEMRRLLSLDPDFADIVLCFETLQHRDGKRAEKLDKQDE